MPRSDLLLSLVRAAVEGDRLLLRRTLEALVAEERRKQHHILADRLAEYLASKGTGVNGGRPLADERIRSAIVDVSPRRGLSDLILPDPVQKACRELIEEHARSDLLRAHGLEPRNRVLLVGPPGNGKTSLSEALAYELGVPLLVVRYEGVVGSYLGETAARLKLVFDYARSRHCVLFFDEFETLGKERGDTHETGEIKRVVSSLLLQFDDLPSYVVLVVATNHPELVDRAAWRRFQIRLYLPPPTLPQLEEWFARFETRLGEPLGYSPKELATALQGLSFAEVEEFTTDILRRRVLAFPEGKLKDIVADRLLEWEARYRPLAQQGS